MLPIFDLLFIASCREGIAINESSFNPREFNTQEEN